MAQAGKRLLARKPVPGFKQSSGRAAGLQAQHEQLGMQAQPENQSHAMCASAVLWSLGLPIGLVQQSALSSVDAVVVEMGGS